jgi:phage tail-like protein
VFNGQLLVQLQGSIVQTLPITQARVQIGRSPDNTLVLQLPMVSKYHAELLFTDQGVLITDLGSEFGTFVAGSRLEADQPYPLLNGLAIQVGPFIINYLPQPVVSQSEEPVSSEVEPLVFDASEVAPGLPRPLLDVPLPSGKAKYLQYLPVIFHQSDFTNRFLQIFEAAWEPLEWRQDHIAMYFDPRTCPASFLPMLSSWIGLDADSRWSEWRHRQILLETATLQRFRGTPYALQRYIELVLDVSPRIVEHPDEPFVFRVQFPLGTELGVLSLAREIIETHKPAHTGYVLEVTA